MLSRQAMPTLTAAVARTSLRCAPALTCVRFGSHLPGAPDPMLQQSLCEADPEIYDLIEKEKNRQWRGLELIASENFAGKAIMEANGSPLTNKYSEGLPHQRYYGGNEFIDQIEELCQSRALKAFHLSPAKWGVNVQPYSGSTANFSAFTALLKPFDRLMGLDLPSGGHLTHGYATAKKKLSASAMYFTSCPYRTNPDTGYVDYNRLAETADVFRPNLIVCGGSAYPRDWDYKRLRQVADQHGAYLLMDMAHISGLVAAQEQSDPFEYCDVVCTTTHKTLRGPRAGLIFYRKDGAPDTHLADLENRVNMAVFPGCQGGPHNNTIAAIAVALKQAATPEFHAYAGQVMKNAQALAARLKEHGYTLVTGGTDNHCVLWDVRPQGLTGSKLEKLYEHCSITINKNSVPKDTSALSPGGIRLGTAALTSRGFQEKEFVQVADFLHRGVQIALEIQGKTGKKLANFSKALSDNDKLKDLEHDVESLACQYGMPGWDTTTMKYRS